MFNPPAPSLTDTLSLVDTYEGFETEPHSVDHQISEERLPNHACAYCGIHSPHSVVRCVTCNKWFCNSNSGTSGSHIVHHLVVARHNVVALHEDSDLGDTTLECYNCGNKNIFVLGFVPAKSETVVVILCRLPCAQSKDVAWDTEEWQSLIEERSFLSWVASVPSESDMIVARQVTAAQVSKLEAKWRSNNASATIADVNQPDAEEEVAPVLLRYTDAFQYQRSFGPLVKLEADYDKMLKESQALEHVTVTWGTSLGGTRPTASFPLTQFESSGLRAAVGDEMILRYSGLGAAPWEGSGYLVRLPDAHQEEFTLELASRDSNPPLHCKSGFTAEFVWKGTSYDRMQLALRNFATNQKSVSADLYHALLGHVTAETIFDIKLPKKFSVKGVAELNVSQAGAVHHVIQRPLSLIQGPPGTGKTVTSSAIVYHLSRLMKEQILVCAPSNVAVDHLAGKLAQMGLFVVRIVARSREDGTATPRGESEHDQEVESSLSLHHLVAQSAQGELKNLLRLKKEAGELSSRDFTKMIALTRKAERHILKSADVVCCTCIGAGDRRLASMQFKTVLIDESTQASEPEVLVPISKGAKQVILVGDHQQLGPVILDKRAGDAGLRQSLFERLVILGHVPIRLEVQYRMNPILSEFPSNMFYEGFLQNGVTSEQRSMPNLMFPWPIRGCPMMFWANYGREEISASGTSFLNRVEAMNCERIVTRLFRCGITPDQIGIITPYEGQRAYVVHYMSMNGSLPQKEAYADVEVASVDAFQGREKDFIILSCVRANDQNSIGFLSDPRRLNVALTRAKYGLVILGNPRALSRNTLWNNLMIHFREKGCLVEGSLDKLQLSSVQLGRSRHNVPSYRQGAVTESSRFDSAAPSDTASLLSFAPDNGALPDFGMPSFAWPPLGDRVHDDIQSLTSSFADQLDL